MELVGHEAERAGIKPRCQRVSTPSWHSCAFGSAQMYREPDEPAAAASVEGAFTSVFTKCEVSVISIAQGRHAM